MEIKTPWSRVREVWRRSSRGPVRAAWLFTAAAALWRALRTVTGDDAYERYVAHHRLHHGGKGVPMSRAEYFRAEQRRRWDGIRRCC
ncbi:MAG: hypothetical protein HONDAALG_04702 [Gammaproteobacteria bacterium]|nr:hypothetical protein [Gammaproteobacteria bacterium]